MGRAHRYSPMSLSGKRWGPNCAHLAGFFGFGRRRVALVLWLHGRVREAVTRCETWFTRCSCHWDTLSWRVNRSHIAPNAASLACLEAAQKICSRAIFWGALGFFLLAPGPFGCVFVCCGKRS